MATAKPRGSCDAFLHPLCPPTVDAANNARFYFFTDVQFKSVWLGVANASQAAAVITQYDTLLARLVRDFNVTLDDVWGPPSNVIPITNPLEFVLELEPVEPNVPFPAYENGGSFFHSVGYEVLARSSAGNSSAAFLSFQKFLYNAYAANRGWAQQACASAPLVQGRCAILTPSSFPSQTFPTSLSSALTPSTTLFSPCGASCTVALASRARSAASLRRTRRRRSSRAPRTLLATWAQTCA